MGTLVNCLTIIGGFIIGLCIKGKVNEKVSTTVMQGLGLCSLYIGISGSLKCEEPIQLIVSMAVGALIGELIDIDKWITKLGDYFENKFKKKDDKVSISEGFVTSSLLFCVGAMAIVGSLESGLNGDNTTLYAKSVLDGVSSIIFSSTLGIGVFLSVFTVLIYQGSITLAASMLSGILSTSVITNMSVVGSVIIIGLGLNILGMTKIKVANLLPAIFIPIIFGLF